LGKFLYAIKTNDVVSALKRIMIELPCKMWIKQCDNFKYFWKAEYDDPLRKKKIVHYKKILAISNLIVPNTD